MIRKIIKIDEEKCDGCGICKEACHEGAIDIVDGKAKLVRENFCDGIGDCLPVCPQGAISFEEREAQAYDEKAVKKMQNAMHTEIQACPGTRLMKFDIKKEDESIAESDYKKPTSRLMQWPCQLKLVNANSPFFDGAKLLVAADCTAYAYAGLHDDFMRGKITVIACPKLDNVDYTEKLTQIIAENDIKSVTVVRMEVPCCGGIQRAVENALKNSGKFMPWQVVTIARDGKILN